MSDADPPYPHGYPWPWDKELPALIAREGGYVNRRTDKGGPTKYGITQATLGSWLMYPATIADVKELTEEEAARIYWRLWICHPRLRLDLLPAGNPPELLACILDTAVLFGQLRTARFVQEAINVRRPGALQVDGWLGEQTRAALLSVDPQAVRNQIVAARLRHHAKVVKRDRTQADYIVGWVERAVLWLT